MHRVALLLALLGVPTSSFAQDIARMDQIVQSYVSNKIFAGSVLVARGSDVIVSNGYGLDRGISVVVLGNLSVAPSACVSMKARMRSGARPDTAWASTTFGSGPSASTDAMAQLSPCARLPRYWSLDSMRSS